MVRIIIQQEHETKQVMKIHQIHINWLLPLVLLEFSSMELINSFGKFSTEPRDILTTRMPHSLFLRENGSTPWNSNSPENQIPAIVLSK